MDFLNVFLAFIVAILITLISMYLATMILVVCENLYDYIVRFFKNRKSYDKR